jgi:ABC-2 type transport system ATP-binding protein
MIYDIETHSLTKKFGNVVAVDNLELKVERNTIYGLVGPDGAGKTTTMRILCSLMDPDKGTGTIGGKDIISDSEDLKGDIGYMPQRFSLYGDLTVMENLVFYAEIYGVPKKVRNEKIKEQLKFSNLTNHSYKLAAQLSGGMKQKLALSCNLIHTPKYLFLDEPTIGVDPVARRELWEILFDLKSQGVTIFVSTPYMDEAERCDEIGLMHKGSIIRNDTPSNIIGEFDKPLYNVLTEDNYKAQDLALDSASIEDAYLVGEFIHIVFNNYELGSKDFKNYLDKEGISIVSMEKTTPSLEDVFVNIVKTYDRKENN